MKDGFSPSSLYLATGYALEDSRNFCAGNLEFCASTAALATEAAQIAKVRLLDAYHGIRNQYSEPDNKVMTGSIRKDPEQP